MPRTRLFLWLFFLGMMAGLAAFLGSYRLGSGWLALGSIAWVVLLGTLANFQTCPTCGRRLPRDSRSVAIFNPRWKCTGCGREF